jgi:hypothetical protein
VVPRGQGRVLPLIVHLDRELGPAADDAGGDPPENEPALAGGNASRAVRYQRGDDP